ncbi:hypothetical protein AAIH69_25330, partial [Paenibacillus sp. MABNS29]
LTIDVYDGKNLAVHHFDASWWDVKDEVSYKNVVLQDYFNKGFFNWEYPRGVLKKNYHQLKNRISTNSDLTSRILDLVLKALFKIYKSIFK